MSTRSWFAGRNFTVLAAVILTLSSCQSAQKTMPHMGVGRLDLEGNLDRDDLVVMNSVEGTSKALNILGPIVQIIDDKHVKVFGISFGNYTDKYTYFSEPDNGIFSLLLGWIRSVSPEDRAYYKALEKSPDADIVLVKSMDRDSWGVPFFYSTREVTFRGKSMRLKED